MTKFFKMGLVILMLLSIVCSATGCTGKDAGDKTQEVTTSGGSTGEVTDTNTDDDNIGSEDDIGDDMRLRKRKVGNNYSYMLGETEVVVEVDIDDYLSVIGDDRVFNFDALAEHYGLTPKWLGYPAAIFETNNTTLIFTLVQASSEFSVGEIDDCFVCRLQVRAVSENKLLYIETVRSSNAIHNIECLYRVNDLGTYYISSHLAVICAYAFENAIQNPLNYSFGNDFPNFRVSSGDYDIP